MVQTSETFFQELFKAIQGQFSNLQGIVSSASHRKLCQNNPLWGHKIQGCILAGRGCQRRLTIAFGRLRWLCYHESFYGLAMGTQDSLHKNLWAPYNCSKSTALKFQLQRKLFSEIIVVKSYKWSVYKTCNSCVIANENYPPFGTIYLLFLHPQKVSLQE